LALVVAAPSHCSAQTISLGQAANYDVFGAYNSSTNVAGVFYSYPASTVDGNVGLASNGILSSTMGGAFNVLGTAFAQNSASQYGASGTPGGGIVTGANLTQANSDALKAYSTAAGWTSANSNVLSLSQNGNNYSVTGLSSNNGQNLINLTSSLGNASGSFTLTISGPGQFLFNLGTGVSLTDVKVVLNGVNQSNVFFNNAGGFAAFGGSDISGTVLNMNGGFMSLDSDMIHGSVVSNGAIDMGSTVIAPELPTITMAAAACLLLVGSTLRVRMRQRVSKNASPQP
jgi:hypothetical protein